MYGGVVDTFPSLTPAEISSILECPRLQTVVVIRALTPRSLLPSSDTTWRRKSGFSVACYHVVTVVCRIRTSVTLTLTRRTSCRPWRCWPPVRARTCQLACLRLWVMRGCLPSRRLV